MRKTGEILDLELTGLRKKLKLQVKPDGTVGIMLVNITEQDAHTLGMVHVTVAALQSALTLAEVKLLPAYGAGMHTIPSTECTENMGFIITPIDPLDLRKSTQILVHCEEKKSGWNVRVTERFPNHIAVKQVTVLEMDYKGNILTQTTD